MFLLSLQQPMLWSHWAVVECCWTRERRRLLLLLGLSFLLWPPPASMAGALLLCRRCRPRNACAYCEHSILWQPLSIVRRAHARPLCIVGCVVYNYCIIWNVERAFPPPGPGGDWAEKAVSAIAAIVRMAAAAKLVLSEWPINNYDDTTQRNHIRRGDNERGYVTHVWGDVGRPPGSADLIICILYMRWRTFMTSWGGA